MDWKGSTRMGCAGRSTGGAATVTRIGKTTGNRLRLLAGTERTSHVYWICLLCKVQDDNSGWLLMSLCCLQICWIEDKISNLKAVVPGKQSLCSGHSGFFQPHKIYPISDTSLLHEIWNARYLTFWEVPLFFVNLECEVPLFLRGTSLFHESGMRGTSLFERYLSFSWHLEGEVPLFLRGTSLFRESGMRGTFWETYTCEEEKHNEVTGWYAPLWNRLVGLVA